MGYLVSASGKVLGPNFNPNLLLADCCWVRGGIGARSWQRGSETILLQPTPPFYTTLAVRFFLQLKHCHSSFFIFPRQLSSLDTSLCDF